VSDQGEEEEEEEEIFFMSMQAQHQNVSNAYEGLGIKVYFTI
jgi:hypothetical protein